MKDREPSPLQILKDAGAVITGSHVVYASGKHGSAYIDKKLVYPHTLQTSRLCRWMANQFRGLEIEAVVAPEVGGVILSQWVAHHLGAMSSRTYPVALYAEKERNNDGSLKKQPDGSANFVFTGTYAAMIAYKRVLVVEDILNTGTSARKVVEATRAAGGVVVGVAAICNRGGVTAKDVGVVPELFALVNVSLDAWEPADCPLCQQGVPINTNVGHGKQFLARQQAL